MLIPIRFRFQGNALSDDGDRPSGLHRGMPGWFGTVEILRSARAEQRPADERLRARVPETVGRVHRETRQSGRLRARPGDPSAVHGPEDDLPAADRQRVENRTDHYVQIVIEIVCKYSKKKKIKK